jgi:lysine 2,3-aminomutase
MLADAGIPLGNQTVLMKGINDDPAVMKELVHKLLMMRVKPYYLYQADLVQGTNHFRTPVQTGLDIIDALRGHTSGLAVPHYIIDTPGGGGKIPLIPNYITSKDGNKLILKNYQDKEFEYPDVDGC